MSDLCLIHEVPLVDEPGGDDMPTIHGRRYCPTCQASLMAARSTGAIVPERQRCICPDGLCLDHCRACNYSGRDLEETCIADPDWEPDDEYLAIREARVIPSAVTQDGDQP